MTESSQPSTQQPPPGQAQLVQESVIRLMSRLAMQHNAVNLSQGFPNEGPPAEGIVAACLGLLGGGENASDELGKISVQELVEMSRSSGGSGDGQSEVSLSSLLKLLYKKNAGKLDGLSQYSMPFGRPQFRQKIRDYYLTHYGSGSGSTDASDISYLHPDKHFTVTLGATEAMASVIRAICDKAGDKILIMEPFHELYPSQAAVFGVGCEYVEIKEASNGDGNASWELDWADFEEKIKTCRAVVLCDPHNPTGKTFREDEVYRICKAVMKSNARNGSGSINQSDDPEDSKCYLITDDIYEHMIYADAPVQKHVFPLCLEDRLRKELEADSTDSKRGVGIKPIKVQDQSVEQPRGDSHSSHRDIYKSSRDSYQSKCSNCRSRKCSTAFFYNLDGTPSDATRRRLSEEARWIEKGCKVSPRFGYRRDVGASSGTGALQEGWLERYSVAEGYGFVKVLDFPQDCMVFGDSID